VLIVHEYEIILFKICLYWGVILLPGWLLSSLVLSGERNRPFIRFISSLFIFLIGTLIVAATVNWSGHGSSTKIPTPRWLGYSCCLTSLGVYMHYILFAHKIKVNWWFNAYHKLLNKDKIQLAFCHFVTHF